MRVGILLILLQSVLLCAETRAEGQVIQAEPADKVVRALLLDDNTQQQEEPEATSLLSLSANFFGVTNTPIHHHKTRLSAVAYSAHPIRGPPARQ